jgi:hypothetical protein
VMSLLCGLSFTRCSIVSTMVFDGTVIILFDGMALSMGGTWMKLGLGNVGKSTELVGRLLLFSRDTIDCLLPGRLNGSSRLGGIIELRSSSSWATVILEVVEGRTELLDAGRNERPCELALLTVSARGKDSPRLLQMF